MQDPKAALARGQEIRIARATLRRAMRERKLCPVDFLLRPPPALDGLEIGRFLDWLPWIGAVRARALVRGIADPHTPIGELDFVARVEIAKRLREKIAPVTYAVAA